jgi:hypothetical protein
MNANVVVQKDGEGYLACVKGSDNLFAYGLTKEQALDELANDYKMKNADYRELG